jgi:hypothetical protein
MRKIRDICAFRQRSLTHLLYYLGFSVLFLFSVSQLRANPVVAPTLVMTAENVVLSVTPDAIIVSGRYRFKRLLHDVTGEEKQPYMPQFELPIPVPAALKVDGELLKDLEPTMVYKNAKFPGLWPAVFTGFPIVEGVKFAAVTFRLGDVLEPEIEVLITHRQPVIRRNGRFFAYYVPHLPNFENFKKQYELRPEAFVVSFEALLGATLKLHTPKAKVLQSTPKLVSIEALHREVLEVEIIPPKPERI